MLISQSLVKADIVEITPYGYTLTSCEHHFFRNLFLIARVFLIYKLLPRTSFSKTHKLKMTDISNEIPGTKMATHASFMNPRNHEKNCQLCPRALKLNKDFEAKLSNYDV